MASTRFLIVSVQVMMKLLLHDLLMEQQRECIYSCFRSLLCNHSLYFNYCFFFWQFQSNLFDTLAHDEWHAGGPKNCHQCNMKTGMFQNVVFISECFNLLSRSIFWEAPFHSFAYKQDEKVEEEACVYFDLVHNFSGVIVVHSKHSNCNWNQPRSSGCNRWEDVSIMFNDSLSNAKCQNLEDSKK